ncbi:MAG: hypothetical protein V8S76_10145 [Lachnospiraceae bacterium]
MRRIKKLFAGVVLFMLAMAFSVTASAASYPTAPIYDQIIMYFLTADMFGLSGQSRKRCKRISRKIS